VFVLTSRSEGLSVATAEAMACGLPAVVTDVGDMADLVREGRNGHLVGVGDAGGLAERIGGLLDDPDRYAAAAAAAREDAVAHAAVNRLRDLYRDLLVDGARRVRES
jgi:glycosyltransferase involved in cell wall biosynthesis